MKCDETKPECNRCTSTGRKCDGYRSVEAVNDSGASATSLGLMAQAEIDSRTKRAVPTLSPKLLLDSAGGEQEHRNYYFFRQRTVPQLSGCFGSEFWERLVPRTTHHHLAIRHAVLALGSLHERFERGDRSIFASNMDNAQGGFALQQYNKAIQSLIKVFSTNERQPMDICLIACVLFACFEVR